MESRETNGDEETIPCGQEEAREEAVRLPHAAVAETTGAHRNRVATSSVTRSHQSARRN
jgi:hypothetical protein